MPSVSDLVTGLSFGFVAMRAPDKMNMTITSEICNTCILVLYRASKRQLAKNPLIFSII